MLLESDVELLVVCGLDGVDVVTTLFQTPQLVVKSAVLCRKGHNAALLQLLVAETQQQATLEVADGEEGIDLLDLPPLVETPHP